MGSLVALPAVFRTLGGINARFAEGDPITEMAALQREFAIFSADHDLRDSLALLGFAPIDEGPQRQQWLAYMDHLKNVPSSNPEMSGHDLIRQTVQDDLEGGAMPMLFQYHDGTSEPRVIVSSGTPLVFSSVTYLVVSVPTQSGSDALRSALKKAPSSKARRAARSGDKASKASKADASKSKKSGKAKK